MAYTSMASRGVFTGVPCLEVLSTVGSKRSSTSLVSKSKIVSDCRWRCCAAGEEERRLGGAFFRRRLSEELRLSVVVTA
eukprot:6460545-Amphidinium_carterae.3